MNFIKNSVNWLLGRQQQQPSSKNQPTQEVEVPQEELKELFEMTADFLSKSKQPMTDEVKLQIYGLYKQANVGDCNTPKPALYQFANKAKWDSWNSFKGMSKQAAMKSYIAAAVKADGSIQAKIIAEINEEDYVQNGEKKQVKKETNKQESVGLKMVEQKDYSDTYSHPYFKPIEKGDPIPSIDHELLLKPNNSPNAYPLHFAIDKERVDLVDAFLSRLTPAQIQSMQDGEGTGILQYAELIENEEILQLVRAKLSE